jgi:hypothetical protein
MSLKLRNYYGRYQHNFLQVPFAKYSQKPWYTKLFVMPLLILLFPYIFFVILIVILFINVSLFIVVGLLLSSLVIVDVYRFIFHRDLFNKDWSEYRNNIKYSALVSEKAAMIPFRFLFNSYTLEKLDTSKSYPFTDRMNKIFVKNYKI